MRSAGGLLNVNIDGDGAICDLRHTLGAPGVKSCLFTGVYAVEASMLGFLPRGDRVDHSGLPAKDRGKAGIHQRHRDR